MSVSLAIRAAAELLSATSDTARLDAELLMAHALNVSRSDMLLRYMDAMEPAAFQLLIERREKREPVAYITGYTEFYGRRFDVKPGVLIPRADSETLIEAVLEMTPIPDRVLDMGTGSGALLLTILAERVEAEGVGTDASLTAIQVAKSNAKALELSGRANFAHADWTTPHWAGGLGQFDLILCNPPYVEDEAELEPDVRQFEPAEALFAGAEGMDDYRIIIPQLGNLLKADGAAILEIGCRQAEMVQDLAHENGFSSEIRQDLGARDRCLILRQDR